MGKQDKSAIGTLVDRSTRFVMLFPLRRGRHAEDVRAAMIETIQSLLAACDEALREIRAGRWHSTSASRSTPGRGLLLRSAFSVAARLEREHQRSAALVFSRRVGPLEGHRRRAASSSRRPQQSAP